MAPPPQIFLSYTRADREKVERLYQTLSDKGFKPWMDIKNLSPGERWEYSIEKAIRNADFFLACLSNNSVRKRGFLQKEIEDALDQWKKKREDNIFLIPVRLEECKVPEKLGGFNWVDLFGEDEEVGREKLVKAIQVGMARWKGNTKVPGNEPVNGDEPATPGDTHSKKKDPVAPRPRRWVIAASGLLAVVVLIIVWQSQTSTSPPPLKVAYLELDLTTGDNQRKLHDEKGMISLMAADVEQLENLSGRAVFENPRVAANYRCAWLGLMATEDGWRAISRQTGDCSFTMGLQGREEILYLRLTIAEQTKLFTINIRPKQP